jgi:microcystin degradation protein MlrC
VVIADTADNPGGGATSDSTFVLRAMVERGIADVAFGGVWDLGAVQLCRDAGVGASFELRWAASAARPRATRSTCT